jgi:WD40 repeat protein
MIWDLGSGRSILSLKGSDPQKWAIAVEGRWMVGYFHGLLTLWDMAVLRRARTFGKGSGKHDLIAFCRDQTHFVTADLEGTLRVWDRRRRRVVRELLGIRTPICSLAMLPDGKRALTGTKNGTIHLWNLEDTRQPDRSRRHGSPVGGVAMAGDGGLLLAASADAVVRMWNTPFGQGRPRVFGGHTAPVRAIAVARDCSVVATAGTDGVICLWDPRSGREICKLKHAVSDGALALGIGDEDDTFTLGAGGRTRSRGRTPAPKANYPTREMAVAISADGKRVISCAGGLVARVWDTKRAKLEFNIDKIPLYEAPDAIPRELEWGDFISLVAEETEARFTSVALSGDGTVAVFGMDDGTMRVWDLNLRAEMRTLVTERLDTGAVALTADGRRVAALAGDALTVWDVRSGETVFRQSSGNPSGSTTGISMDRDGGRVVVAYGKAVTVWFPNGRSEPVTFTGENEMLSCALTPDGEAVVAGDRAGDLHWLELVLPGPPPIRPPASEVVGSSG